RLALLLFFTVACGHQHELAGRLQRLFDGREHRAEEGTVQLRDQHADGVAAARGQRYPRELRDFVDICHRYPLLGMACALQYCSTYAWCAGNWATVRSTVVRMPSRKRDNSSSPIRSATG